MQVIYVSKASKLLLYTLKIHLLKLEINENSTHMTIHHIIL